MATEVDEVSTFDWRNSHGVLPRVKAVTSEHRLGAWALTWRYLLAFCWVPLPLAVLLVEQDLSREPPPAFSGFLILEILGVIAALVLIRFRRRAPMLVTVSLSALSSVAVSLGGFASWGVASLCTRRRWKEILPAGAVFIGSQLLSYPVRRALGLPVVADLRVNDAPLQEPWSLIVGGGALLLDTVVLVAIGMYTGARRELVASMRAQVEQAEREQQLRVAQGQAAERQRIAREMHDVLAHRISLVSMYSGALAYRDDLNPEQTREIAETIRENANLALTELRGVLGSLRGEEGDRPQPTLADLPGLIADNRAAGVRIEFSGVALEGLSPAVSRHAYRIVQEGLTNARKHAPGAKVEVRLSGDPDSGLRIELRNLVNGRGAAVPGGGYGLLGLAERTGLVGGRIEHGIRDEVFQLEAWMPW